MANGGIIGPLRTVICTASCVSASTTAFTSSGTFRVACGAQSTTTSRPAAVLVIAGGGAGAAGCASGIGGGGAGGVILTPTSYPLPTSSLIV